MASVKAFNTLMQQFLDELSKVFPKEPKLRLYCQQFPMLCESNSKKPMEVFVSNYSSYMGKIQTQDETLFDDVPKFFGEVDVKHLWGQCDAATRDTIWKYLQHLSFMATTVNLIPPDMLSMIESIAMDCASKIEGGQMDANQLMSMLPQLMGSMPK